MKRNVRLREIFIFTKYLVDNILACKLTLNVIIDIITSFSSTFKYPIS